MRSLRNREVVIKKLTKLLLKINAENRQYDTDIYLHINKNGYGEIKDCIRGSEWPDDDSIYIWHVARCDTLERAGYNDVEDLCRGAGITLEELRQQIGDEDEYDTYENWGADIEVLYFQTAADFIEEHYHDRIVKDYYTWCDENVAKETAKEIMDNYDEARRND